MPRFFNQQQAPGNNSDGKVLDGFGRPGLGGISAGKPETDPTRGIVNSPSDGRKDELAGAGKQEGIERNVAPPPPEQITTTENNPVAVFADYPTARVIARAIALLLALLPNLVLLTPALRSCIVVAFCYPPSRLFLFRSAPSLVGHGVLRLC